MEKVSIVVPVYNVEKYIEKCLDSIINQSFSNIEIILVDDGSTDNSGKICDIYEKKDTRIKVIHKKNGGLSDARNYGIEVATGEFISFIDSDDYIEENMIERLYESCKKDESDISCCAKILEYDNGKKEKRNNKENFCITNIEALGKMFIFDDIDNSACDKLFSKKLFTDIKFPVGNYYEDIATIYKVFMKAKKISHIIDVCYHYIMRENSISNKKFDIRQIDMIKFSKKSSVEVSKKYPDIKQQANSFYYLNLINIIIKIKNADDFNKFKKEYISLKKEYNSILFKL